MEIYSSQNQSRYLEELRDYNCRVMLTPSYKVKPSSNKELKEFRCALDNGAFTCYKKGYPFQESMFLGYIEKCFAEQFTLDFIVIPDIVGGGLKSAEYSIEWIDGKLKTAPSLAFVVQDGMTPENLEQYKLGNYNNITHLFIGGTKEWKIKNLAVWAKYAKSLNIKSHAGQIGTLDRLILCHDIGIDSIDSQNFSRHNTWSYLEEYKKFYSGHQSAF
jgi:hypothetical protein